MSGVKFAIRWGKAEAVTPGVLAEGGFSVATRADVPGETASPLAVIFDNARAELRAQPQQAGEQLSDVMYAVWTGSLRVPVEVVGGRPGVWFKSDLRCSLRKDEGTRALLVADLAGEQVVREFPYGQRVEGENFEQSVVHEAGSLPVGGYAVSLLLVVERRGHESGVELVVDSLDVEINPNFRG